MTSIFSRQNGHDLRRAPVAGPRLSRRLRSRTLPRDFAMKQASLATRPSRQPPPVPLPQPLEGDVVVGGRGAARGARGLEVGRVGRDVTLRGEAPAATVLATLAAAQELDGVGDDVDRLALLALGGVPLAPLEPAVDGHGAALRQVLGAVLALGAPDGDVEVVGLVHPLPRGILAARVAGQPQAADRRAAVGAAQFGVPGQVAREDDPVDVRGCHSGAPISCFGRLGASPTECTSEIGASGWALAGNLWKVRGCYAGAS